MKKWRGGAETTKTLKFDEKNLWKNFCVITSTTEWPNHRLKSLTYTCSFWFLMNFGCTFFLELILLQRAVQYESQSHRQKWSKNHSWPATTEPDPGVCGVPEFLVFRQPMHPWVRFSSRNIVHELFSVISWHGSFFMPKNKVLTFYL